MNLGTWIIVTTLIAIGSFFGGGEYRHYQDCKLPPKIQNITQIQTTENHNNSVQENSQAQFTIVTPMTNFKVNYNGKTNISVSRSTRTNRMSKTNK